MFYFHQGYIRALAYSRDGVILASGADDYSIKLFDVDRKILLGAFQNAHQGKFLFQFRN